MNVQLKLNDMGWQTFFAGLKDAIRDSNTLLKKAFIIIWPKEEARIFDEEMGPDGRWAPWKNSTRQGRIVHEIQTTTAKQRAFAKTSFVREGGKLLVKSGRLRTETIQNPEMVELPDGLKVLSPTPYSGFLDEGTSKMVARPFMWLGDEAQGTLADILMGQIMDQAGGTD